MKKKVFSFLRLILEAFVLFFIYALSNGVLMTVMPMGVVATSVCILVVSIVTIGVFLLFERFLEKKPWGVIFERFSLVSLFKGFAVGALFMSAVVALIALLGCYGIESYSFDWNEMYKWLIMFLYVGIGEEIMFRGVIFGRVAEMSNVIVAIVISGLLFGLVHISNSNATVWSSVAIAIEAGCMLGAAYAWSKTLLFPIGIHWAWNYFEGYVYGTSVSGNGVESFIKPVISGNDIISGGQFGPEASVVAVILGTALTIVFIRMMRTVKND